MVGTPLPRPVRKLAYRVAQLSKQPGVYRLTLIVDQGGEMQLMVEQTALKVERLT